MSDPADIDFLDIIGRAREDAGLVDAQKPTDDTIRRFIRDAYQDIVDKRPDARLRNDGTLMPHALDDAATTLYWELIEFRLSFIYYVMFRMRSLNMMEPTQAKSAASYWREYLLSLGLNSPPEAPAA